MESTPGPRALFFYLLYKYLTPSLMTSKETQSNSFLGSISSTFTSWSSSLQKGTEEGIPGTLKRFGDLSLTLQQKARQLPANIVNLPNAFEAEREHFLKANEDNRSRNAKIDLVAPWEGYGAYEKLIKERVLALSKDQRNFTIPPPDDTQFQFDMKAYSQSAAAALKHDPNLAHMRFTLVPQYVQESTFWRNYFYRVTLEKQAALNTPDIDPNVIKDEEEKKRNDVLFDFPESDDDNTDDGNGGKQEKQVEKKRLTEKESGITKTLSTTPTASASIPAPANTKQLVAEDDMEEWERELRRAASEL
ncbi:hypothetical protein BX666DRAFT_1936561 [Dichotomocladium elegans]|nr:hypothetical protein BX666DRAFT_1936561 [Dichotomocladium elegans]